MVVKQSQAMLIRINVNSEEWEDTWQGTVVLDLRK